MTETTEVLRTVVCPLETSERKTEKLRRGVADFQRIAKTTAALLPSFPEQSWQRNNSQIYRTVKAQCDWEIKDKVAQNAVHRVVANYKSTRELGNDPPKDGIVDCDFLILTNQGYDIEPNNRGYGLKAKFIPYDTEWFHLDIGDYQAEYVADAVDGNARFGSTEIALNDGEPVARIAVGREQETTTLSDAEYVAGVDIGYRSLYAAAVREQDTGQIVAVDVQTGDEFRHERKAIQRRLTRFKRNRKLAQAKRLRERERRYTDQTMHETARAVVDLAQEYEPCIIRLEELTNYREKIDDPVHDWPYNSLQEKIIAKAEADGIGTEVVEPYYTSQTCRKCGYQDAQNREETSFECLSCGYQVNADVNAAMNLAKE